jgi:hypothetical protein
VGTKALETFGARGQHCSRARVTDRFEQLDSLPTARGELAGFEQRRAAASIAIACEHRDAHPGGRQQSHGGARFGGFAVASGAAGQI